MLSMITGDASFAANADLFHEDFPDPKVTGTVIVAAGTSSRLPVRRRGRRDCDSPA